MAVAALALVAITVSACGGSPSTNAPPARRSPATVILRSAGRAMARAANFTFAATVVTHGTTTKVHGQFQAPDRDHLIVSNAGGVATELLLVGTKAFIRAADGSWQSQPSAAAAPSDPRGAFGILTSATDVRAAAKQADGTRYRFVVPASAARVIVQSDKAGPATSLTGTALVTANSIADLTLTDPGGTFAADIAYSAIGLTSPIPVPPGT